MKRVLSIGAHPDDIEIGCGGTEAKLKSQGYDLLHVIATAGEQGSLKYSPEELGIRRKKEARSSAEILGAESVIFLGLKDGLTSFGEEDKIALIKIIREYRPEIIFTHSKSDHFPDHLLVRSLTDSAILGASGPWYPKAPGTPHVVSKVFGYEVWNPLNSFQYCVDITTTMDKKIRALKCHESQIEDVDYIGGITGLAQYRGSMTMTGKFAEVFEVIQMRETHDH